MRTPTTTYQTTIRIAGFLFLALVTFSCAWGKKSGAELAVKPNISAEGFEFFQQSITPFTMAHCNECHGNAQSPLFAVDSSLASRLQNNYLLLRDRVNFSDPHQSIAVEKVLAGHYQCSEPCDEVGEELAGLIELWGQYETNGGEFTGGAFQTGEVLLTDIVPLFNPDDPEYQTISFSLSGAGNGINGATFKIDVANFDNDFWILTRPRIEGHNVNVYVKGLRGLINRAARSTEETFAALETTLAVGETVLQETGAPLLSVVNGSGFDKLSFSFDQLREGAGACKDLALFTANVYPIMQNASRCYGCHDGSNARASTKFSMVGDALTVCQRARLRVDFTQAEQSLILRRPLNGFRAGEASGMPVQFPGGMTDPDYLLFRAWVDSEVLQGR